MAGQVPAETYLIRHWRAGPVSKVLLHPESQNCMEIMVIDAGQFAIFHTTGGRASLAILRISTQKPRVTQRQPQKFPSESFAIDDGQREENYGYGHGHLASTRPTRSGSGYTCRQDILLFAQVNIIYPWLGSYRRQVAPIRRLSLFSLSVYSLQKDWIHHVIKAGDIMKTPYP
jgi:hypothetical protein